MKHADEAGPWLMTPNQRTGRIEVFKDDGKRDRFVGSMPGNATDAQMQEMIRKLEADPQCS